MEGNDKRYWSGNDDLSSVGIASDLDFGIYQEKMSRVLRRMGGLYSFEDIMDKIRTGHMQSFAHRNTWVVTEVHDYPRRRVLDILFLVGDIADVHVLHHKVVTFAEGCGATLIRAFGRPGWTIFVRAYNWEAVDVIYHKEL